MLSSKEKINIAGCLFTIETESAQFSQNNTNINKNTCIYYIRVTDSSTYNPVTNIL